MNKTVNQGAILYLGDFTNHIAPYVDKNNGAGWISNNNGNFEYLTDEIFDYTSDFVNHFAEFKRNGKYGFVNEDGFIIAEGFDNVWFFTEDGIASVKIDGKYLKINTNGELIG